MDSEKWNEGNVYGTYFVRNIQKETLRNTKRKLIPTLLKFWKASRGS